MNLMVLLGHYSTARTFDLGKEVNISYPSLDKLDLLLVQITILWDACLIWLVSCRVSTKDLETYRCSSVDKDVHSFILDETTHSNLGINIGINVVIGGSRNK